MFYQPHVHLEIAALKADFVQAQRAQSCNLWNVLDFAKVAFQVALVKSGIYRSSMFHVLHNVSYTVCIVLLNCVKGS